MKIKALFLFFHFLVFYYFLLKVINWFLCLSFLFPSFSLFLSFSLSLPFFWGKVWWARIKRIQGSRGAMTISGPVTGMRRQLTNWIHGKWVSKKIVYNDNGQQFFTVREEIYKYGNIEGRLTSVVSGWTWRHWCGLVICNKKKEI